MGLFFQMPVELNELDDRVVVNNKMITLKSYGPPMIFWGYLAAIFSVLFFMGLAIYGPIISIYQGQDFLNKVIAIIVIAIFVFIPLVSLGFFFYEKNIKKENDIVTITHKVFFIPVFKKKIVIQKDGLYLEHFLDSPNVAHIEKKKELAGFQNRGYFKLMARSTDGTSILIDRNSRKSEMKKLLGLLNSY